jgi:hypothetical protein
MDLCAKGQAATCPSRRTGEWQVIGTEPPFFVRPASTSYVTYDDVMLSAS